MPTIQPGICRLLACLLCSGLVGCSSTEDKTVEGDAASGATDAQPADADGESTPVDVADPTSDAGPSDSGPADVPPVDPCPALCAGFAACALDVTTAECLGLCQTDPTAEHRTCLQNSVDCGALASCLGLAPEVLRPFDDGPGGLLPKGLASAFTVTTDGGAYDFKARWTGQESFIFIRRFPGDKNSDGLWNSSLDALLTASPKTVHYFFMVTRESDGSDKVAAHMAALKTRMDAALGKLPAVDRDHWRKHLHRVAVAAPKPGDQQAPQGMSGWLGEELRKRGVYNIAIDRFQRIRDVGLLFHPGNKDTTWQLAYLANEARHYDFEHDRQVKLDQDGALVVGFLEAANTASVATGYAELPAAAEMAKYDTLEVDVAVNCPNHLDSNCGEWDYNSHLHLCDLPSAATPDHDKTFCDTEIARWVTTYSREGRWVTDISAMLAHLQEGGKRRLKWSASKQGKKCFGNNVCIDTAYVTTASLRLRNTGKGVRPVQIVQAFSGGKFGPAYNDNHKPLTFQVPEGVKKVGLHALITGHGFGKSAENCSEFCNHEHHFSVGGKTFVRDHPEAQSQSGCLERISEGVVPNQFGTWPYGRGGWCPGLDVMPWVQDITAQVDLKGDNLLTYQGLFKGKPYTPTPLPGKTSADGGNIKMFAWLVFYK